MKTIRRGSSEESDGPISSPIVDQATVRLGAHEPIVKSDEESAQLCHSVPPVHDRSRYPVGVQKILRVHYTPVPLISYRDALGSRKVPPWEIGKVSPDMLRYAEQYVMLLLRYLKRIAQTDQIKYVI